MNIFFRRARLTITSNCRYSQIKGSLKNVLPNGRFIVGYKNYSCLSYTNKKFLRQLKYSYLNKCSYFNEVGGNNEPSWVEVEDLQESTQCFAFEDVLPHVSIRNILYPESKDPVIIKLNECSTILEILDLINEENTLKYEHIAQAVLVLWDLQKMLYNDHYYVNKILPNDISTKQEFSSQITSHPKFLKLLENITTHLSNFDVESLSCILLYLQKIGLDIKHPVMQLIVIRLQGFLRTNLPLNALSRFIVALFSDFNLGSFFIVQDALPILERELEKCDTVEELKLITICMIHLQQIINDDLLQKYTDKVIQFKNNNLFSAKDYRPLLKIIIFLSSPQWNIENAVLVSELMLLLKNNLHLLNVFDFFMLYEVFYRNQEPGELLTELQRCGSRLLLHLEDEINLAIEVKIKLLTSIICFSSPLQRYEYEKLILQSLKQPFTKQSMFDMLKILTFVKPNSRISKLFWDNATQCITSLKLYNDIEILLGLCHKYMNYNNDVQYRHREFETQMLTWLKFEFENGMAAVVPSSISLLSAFILAYAEDKDWVNRITQKVSDNWEQFNHIDCLYISKGIRSVSEMTKNPFVKAAHLNTISNALDKAIKERLSINQDSVKLNFLIKSCLYRKVFNKELFHKISDAFDNHPKVSSNSMRNMIYSLQTSSTLLPKFMETLAEYVINYKDHLLGFNAEKVAYFCFWLGYLPTRSDELFQTITDVIIRDQERISGLSYLQAALALCFFNKLPESFIRRIFNVSFLEKLDMELAKCYSKDIYPIRVRRSMMQLNRAMCLDYPQANVPWFHEKYIDEMKIKDKVKFNESDPSSVRSYLLQIVGNKEFLLENVISAYGYHIDYLINLDSNGNLTLEPDEHTTRVALLLVKQNAYTNLNVQLKGQFQMKTRHLEILGYKVLHINIAKWNSLFYGEEKLEYIKNMIWPNETMSKSSSSSISI